MFRLWKIGNAQLKRYKFILKSNFFESKLTFNSLERERPRSRLTSVSDLHSNTGNLQRITETLGPLSSAQGVQLEAGLPSRQYIEDTTQDKYRS